jgi:hypothetical protein
MPGERREAARDAGAAALMTTAAVVVEGPLAKRLPLKIARRRGRLGVRARRAGESRRGQRDHR